MSYKSKEEQAAYGAAWYQKNKVKVKKASALSNEARRKKNRDMVNAIKESVPCADCGNFFPAICMDFDHTEDNKIANVSTLIAGNKHKSIIMAEVAKCEIVCSNCHRIRTQARLVERNTQRS